MIIPYFNLIHRRYPIAVIFVFAATAIACLALFIALAGALDRPLHDYGRKRLDKVTQAAVTEQLHPMLYSWDKIEANAESRQRLEPA